jgi:PleD family two-component response regulator
VEKHMQQWKKLGQILIENGILSPRTVDRVLAVSKRHNKRFGWTLEKLELVTGDEMSAALAQQYKLKMVSNLTSYSYPQELLKIITSEVAMQHLIFPLKMDGGKLLLAVADPTDLKIVNNMAANLGLLIIPCVATRKDIYAVICKHYLGKQVQESKKETVLVVEDELLVQTYLKDLLLKSDYRVLVANDGLEGFKEIIINKPHVIITDKVMPKLDGFSLLESIKAIPEIQSIPVILMSDKLSTEEEGRVFDRGFFDYIPKPVNEITLISRVKRAFSFSDQKYSFF